jgi:hypothetical protein
MFIALQQDISRALLDPERGVPHGIAARTAASSERFAIYRNNVIAGLVGALRTRFPAVEKIVGVDYFAALARVFVSGHPPRSPVLLDYCDDFAAFLERFEPARELPYLADVARIESARVRAYHAADDTACAASDLASVPPVRLSHMRIALRDAVRVVRSPHPAVTIWAMNSGKQPLGEIADWRGECALVVRPEREVIVQRIGESEAVFLTALLENAQLGTAVGHAREANPEFDTTRAIANLFALGLAARIDPGKAEERI